MSQLHSEEIKAGDRFSFGENWSRFLSVLNEDRIHLAKALSKPEVDTVARG